jgi:hypothetical protein
MQGLFQPCLPRETADLLDRAEDGLYDTCPAHNDTAGSIRQLVLPLLVAVFRIDVHGRLAETRPRQFGDVEPELLDLALALEMVGEEVASKTDRLVVYVEATAEKSDEEANHLRVRIREAERVAGFSAFGLEEHAASDVEGIPLLRELTSLLLIRNTFSTSVRRLLPRAAHLTVVRNIAHR